jgi:hypothetical protein
MIHFITYGDSKYKNSRLRLISQAKESNWFDTITDYTPDTLCKKFKDKYSTILTQSRGGGYWIWKPYIIKSKMDTIEQNDIIIYMDAGSSINLYGENRFKQYIDMVKHDESGMISFQLCHAENKYTVSQIFDLYNIDISKRESGQYMATVLIMKKNKNTCHKVEQWFNTLSIDHKLFTDYYNKFQNYNYFVDNRHDQSVFSVIRKIDDNTIVIKDETYFKPFGNDKSMQYPFWATRIK